MIIEWFIQQLTQFEKKTIVKQRRITTLASRVYDLQAIYNEVVATYFSFSPKEIQIRWYGSKQRKTNVQSRWVHIHHKKKLFP